MKLKTIYQEVIKKGIDVDVRGKKEIEKLLKNNREIYDKLDKREKEFFDTESFFNPFSDTRILNGDPEIDIKNILIGIDIDVSEVLLAERLNSIGKKIDLVISHHPIGRAYANFYEVMDLQVDIFLKEGLSLSVSENLLKERKSQVERKVHAVNHQRTVDVAKLLGINLFCMHTPCDNLAHQYIYKLIEKEKPNTLGKIIDILYEIQEYRESSKLGNPPKIVIGNKNSRVNKIHIEFTGGTEGPQEVYRELASKGVDTIISMHQSEEHFKKSKEANLNVIFASHIASDTLGVNLMLDHLEKKEKFKIFECSGFRRFIHK
ncbi:MAG: NGG1p interacting factor NIF3 [Candidatus Aenigmatarchaeota archaeon]